MTYRTDIDGLRAIAVLSVVFFHAFPTVFPGGFIGVDIFFVISGFLISNILFYQMKNGGINWSRFYLKRIKRIFPALIVTLFSTAIIGYFLLFPIEYEHLGKHLWGGSSFLNNIILWREAGYFDKASELKPLLHLWSLGIEEQFYLVWPVLIYLIYRLRLNPLKALITFSMISFIFNLAWVHHQSIRAFYLPMSRFWELALGGILAYTSLHKPRMNLHLLLSIKRLLPDNIMSTFALSILLMGIFSYTSSINYPGWAAILPVLCTLLLIYTPSSWINRKVLSFQGLTFVGLVSYPLYLWHWELFSFAQIIYSGKAPAKLIGFLIIISFVLAWITYQWIEKPIRFSHAAEKHPIQIASVLCGCLAMIGLMGLAIQKDSGLGSRLFVKRYETLLNDIQGFDEYKKQVIPCELASTNQNLKNISNCLQNKKGPPQKVIWGDSHAEHLFPGIIESDKKNTWLLLAQSGCPPLHKVASYWKGSRDICVKTNDLILKTILKTPSIDTVILTSLGSFYISDESYAAANQGDFAASNHFLVANNSKESKRDVFFHGLNKTINELKKAGKKVVLFQDTPEVPFMPESCLGRPLAPKGSCIIGRHELLSRQKEYISLLSDIEKIHNVPLFNPIDLVCDEGHCSLIKKERLIYRDSHHLSITGSKLVSNNLILWLNKTV